MKTVVLSLLVLFCFTGVQAQMPAVQHIARLEIDKKKNKIFSSRDSSLTMTIDTLIMKDRSRLVFYGKKDVTLKVKHAEIGKDVVIVGTDGKNNGSDMDLSIRFEKLGNLLLTTAGLDASNGTKTFPNGNGGELTFKYLTDGLIPQQEDKKAEAYVSIDTKAGGYS